MILMLDNWAVKFTETFLKPTTGVGFSFLSTKKNHTVLPEDKMGTELRKYLRIVYSRNSKIAKNGQKVRI